MSGQHVTAQLHDLWKGLNTLCGSTIDERITLLRLLDVAIWMAGGNDGTN